MSAVEWKKLGDVCEIIKGCSLSKNDVGTGECPVILYGELYTTYGDYITSIKSCVSSELAENATPLKYNDLVLPVSSTTKEAQIGKSSVIKVTNNVSLGSDAIILRNSPNSDFLMYYINSQLFEKEKMQCVNGTTIMHLSPKKMSEKKIPMPSAEEQIRIVGILDTFTTLISNLESELDMRRKQYEHYRNQLLDFEGVEKLPLSEVFEMRGGYTPSTKNDEFWKDGTLPWFRMEDIRENGNILSDSTLHITPIAVKKNGLFPMNSIILATSATIGVHALLTVPALSNQRFTAFYPKQKYENKVNYKYTYYIFYIIDEWCKNNIVQGGFASVDMAGLRKYLFPLPSLVKQQQIVEKLDAFENLIQSLEQEIKLRKQQYEYYREKLLTFE
ncbi:MAG: restriction endonuclease subunit S [Bacteroidaceae bacterium]|nr:restriction endonuclease subunit S [Bacteroidaceae bacterium]